MVMKGRISAILDRGDRVTVAPYGGGVVTVPLAVPTYLRGFLPVNTIVVYAVFEDNTGLILGRLDGFANISTGSGSVNMTADGENIVIEESGNSNNLSVYSDDNAIVIEKNNDSFAFSAHEDAETIVFEFKGG